MDIIMFISVVLPLRITNVVLLKRLAVPTTETQSFTSRECITCQKSNENNAKLYADVVRDLLWLDCSLATFVFFFMH